MMRVRTLSRLLRLSAALVVMGTTQLVFAAGPGGKQHPTSMNALPSGGKVVAGSATIKGVGGNVINVNQTSERAVVNWDTFNVAKGATVNFNQPSSNSTTLNYVKGADASVINGTVNANGQVILVNSNGVVFGKGAEVNVGGMVATTMDTSAEEFMSGKNTQTYKGVATGKVINRGRINVMSPDGYVALMAPEVQNEGVVLATMSGKNAVALVAGQQVTLTFNGSQLTNVSVDASLINALIENKRLIKTEGGHIVLAANSVTELMGSTIKNTGVISANSINTSGGKIRLTAETITQAGTITANGGLEKGSNKTPSPVVSQMNATGGDITIQGKEITLAAGSVTSAKGAARGGNINVGTTKVSYTENADGTRSNITAENLADRTTLEFGSLVDASSVYKGQGGEINIWSLRQTNVAGVIKAHGGQFGGNGGNVETSAIGILNIAQTASVNVSARLGKAGQWLLDPESLTIDNAMASAVTSALATANVTIAVSGDLTIAAGTTIDLTVMSGSSLSSSGTTLTLNATGSVTNNGVISLGTGASVVVNAASVNLASGSTTTANQVNLTAQTISVSGAVMTAGGGSSSANLLANGIAVAGVVSASGSASGTGAGSGTTTGGAGSTTTGGTTTGGSTSGGSTSGGSTSGGSTSGGSTSGGTGSGGSSSGGSGSGSTGATKKSGAVATAGALDAAVTAATAAAAKSLVAASSAQQSLTTNVVSMQTNYTSSQVNAAITAAATSALSGLTTVIHVPVTTSGTTVSPSLMSITIAPSATVGSPSLVTSSNATTVSAASGGSVNLQASQRIQIASTAAISADAANAAGTSAGAGQVNIQVFNGAANVSGTVSASSTSGQGGVISMAANDVAFNARVLANGTTGGSVSVNAAAGNVNVNNATVQTNGSQGPGGTIKLVSSNIVQISSSTLQANSDQFSGGNIAISGNSQTNLSAATVEARGFSQGGTILVGNDAKNGTLPFTQAANLDAATLISTQQTDTTNTTNGGFIETSGSTIKLLASINAGRGGMWLIDPSDILIDSALASSISSSSSNVEITTSSTSASVVSSGNGNIYVNSAINKTVGSLTFTPSSATYLSANVTAAGGQTYNGTVYVNGNITLSSTNSDVTITGSVSTGYYQIVEIGTTTGGGRVSVNGAAYTSSVTGLSYSSGTYTYTTSGAFNGNYLLVGGGGGGGSNWGGGGGAGGVVTGTTSGASWSVSIGPGGVGATAGNGGSGGDSSAFGAIAYGGGGGGAGGSPGLSGASGGGAGGIAANAGGTATQGYAGGTSVANTGGSGGGGSGGAGAPGGTPSAGGKGGDGTVSAISGSSVAYAAGGGGAAGDTGTFAGGNTGTSGTPGTGGSSGAGGIGGTCNYGCNAPGGAGSTPGSGGGGGSTNGGVGGNGAAGIAILSGTVRTGSGSLTIASGSGKVDLSGSSINLSALEVKSSSTTSTISAAIVGSTALTLTAPLTTGILTLSGNNTYTGATTINTGYLSISAPSNINGGVGGLTLAGGGLRTSADITLNPVLTLAALKTSVLYAAGSATLTINGNITGAGNLLIANGATGTVVLGGTNDFTGSTTIYGKLTLANANALSTSALTIGSPGLLDVAGYSISNPITVNLSGARIRSSAAGGALTGGITLAGNSITLSAASGASLTVGTTAISGTGTTALAIGFSTDTGSVVLSAANTYVGTTSVSKGTLIITNASGLGTADAGTTISSGTTLDLQGVIVGAEALTINGGTLATSTGTSSLSGAISLGASGSTFSVAGTQLTLSGIIAGGNGFTTTDSGTLILSGGNTYTGTTTISAGTLKADNAAALGPTTGAGTVSITSGAVLDLNGQSLTNSGTLTLRGTGIGSGGALINSSATAASYSGLIALGAASSIEGGTGTIALTNVGTITGATYALTLGGAQGGSVASIIGTTSGTVTKAGAGTWTLSGANTYTGATTIAAGTLKADNAAALGPNAGAGAVSVTSGAVLDLNGQSLTNSGTLTIRGTGIGASGALINSSATAASYSGLIALGAASSIVGDTGTIALSNVGTIAGATYALTLGGAQGGSISSIIGITSGAVNKSGAGTWLLSGANTYTGNTTISAGVLKVGHAAALGPLTGAGAVSITSGAVLDLNGQTLTNSGELTVNGTGVGAGGALINSSASPASYAGLIKLGSASSIVGGTGTIAITNAGTITGATFALVLGGAQGGSIASIVGTTSGGLTKEGAGTWTLLGANTYTGTTLVSAGTLALGASNVIANASVLTINGGIFALDTFSDTVAAVTIGTDGGAITSSTGILYGTSYTFNNSGANTATVSAILGSSANLTQAGTGVTTLSGANTYTGTTTISAGTLIVSNPTGLGGLTNGTTIASGAKLDLQGVAIGGELITMNGGTLSTSSGVSSLTGNVVLGASGNAFLVDGTSLTLSGVVSGDYGFSKTGSGTLILRGANTFGYTSSLVGNVIVISGGTLQVAGTSGFTSYTGDLSLNIASSAVFQHSSSSDVSIGGIVSGVGSIIKDSSSTSTLFLTATGNDLSGGVQIKSGTLEVWRSQASGVISLGDVTGNNPVVLRVVNNTTLTNPIYLNPNGIISLNNDAYAITLSGGITGSNNFSVNAVRDGSYLGSITFSHAALNFSGSFTNYGSGGDVTINSTLGPNITSVVQNASNSKLILNGANTYAGATTVQAGTLQLGSSGSISNLSSLSLSGSGNLDLNGVTQTFASATGSVNTSVTNSNATTATLTVNGGTTTFAGLIKDKINLVLGGGALTLSGANTYTGTTTVNAGTLIVGHATGLGTTGAGTTIASGATLDLQNVAVGAEAITINGGTIATSTGTSSLSGAISLGASDSIFSVAGTQLTLSGIISGSNGFTKDGSGILIFSRANTYTGTATVSAGTLAITNASGLGATAAGTTIASGATLDLRGVAALAEALTINGGTLATSTGTSSLSGAIALGASGTTISVSGTELTLSGVISGSGGLTKAGAGNLILTGTNTYDGNTNIDVGTLTLGSLTPWGTGGTISFGGGTLKFTASNTTDYSSRFSSAINQAYNIDTNSQNVVFASALSSSGGVLNKFGAGTLTLAGNNTYSGETTVSAGTLSITHNNGLGSTAAGTTVASGAILDLLGVAVGSEAITLSGGTLQDVTSSLAGNITLTADSTISATNANDVLTLSGNISGNFAITKAGLGTVIFTGMNAYTGGTSINAGTLSIGTATPWGASGTISFGGGTLQYSSSNATDYSARFSSAANQAYNIDTNGQNVTFASDLTSSGGTLSKAGSGTLTLAGNNTYSGTTTVSAGTLAITSATGLGDAAGGTTVASGATLDLRGVTVGAETITINGGTLSVSTGSSSLSGAVTLSADSFVYVSASSDLTFAGAISGSAGFTLSGGGTLSLDGNNTYSGTTTVSAGTLAITSATGLGDAAGGTTVASGATLDLRGVTVGAETITINGGTLSVSTGSSSLSGAVTLSADSFVYVSASSDLTLAGVVSGSAGFTLSGGGTLSLDVANQFTGTAVINDSLLIVRDAAALGSTSGGTVVNGASAELLLSPGMTVSGENLTLNGSYLSTQAGLGSSWSGNISLTANSAISTNGSFEVSGVISSTSTYGFTKTGSSTLILSNANTYTGTTTISAGTLKVGNAASLGPSTGAGAVSITSGAVLDLNGQALTNSGTLTIRGTGIGSGGVLINGSSTAASYSGLIALDAASSIVGGTGTIALTNVGIIAGATYGLTLGGSAGGSVTSVIGTTSGTVTKQDSGTWTLSGANSFTGTTTVSAGTLAITNATGLGTTSSGTTIASGATLDIQNVVVGAEAITINGGTLATSTGTSSLSGNIALGATNNTFSVTGTQLTLSGVISGTSRGITKEGSGILVLSAANSYSSSTTINAGVLSVSTINSSGANSGIGASTDTASQLIIDGGTLRFTGSATTTNRLFTVGANGATIEASGSGLLTFNNSGQIATVSGSAPTLTLAGTGSGSLNPSWSNPTSGTSALTKSGASTWTIASGNTNSYSGPTTISGGVLSVSSLVNGGSNSGIGSSSSAASNLVIDGGTLKYTGSAVGVSINRLFTVGANGATIDSSGTGGTLTFSATGDLATVSGTTPTLTLKGITSIAFSPKWIDPSGGIAAFAKAGTNTATLSALNTYSGATTVEAGTLTAGSVTAFGAGNITVASGAALDLYGKTMTSTGGLTINGTGVSSNGALTNSSSTAATYAGLLTLGSASSIGYTTVGVGEITLSNVGTITGQFDLTLGGATGGGGTIASIIGTGAGGIIKTGNSTWTLNGANTYDGATAINAGTLNITNATGLGSTVGATTISSGATLRLANVSVGLENLTINGGEIYSVGSTSSLSGNILLGANSTFNAATGNLTLSGNISSGGSTFGFSKAGVGTLILSGDNTFSGVVSFSAASGSTLRLGSATALGSASKVSISAMNVTLDVAGWETSRPIEFTNSGYLTSSTGTGGLVSGDITTSSTTNSNIQAGSGAVLTISGVIKGSGTGAVVYGSNAYSAPYGIVFLSGSTANTYSNASTIGASSSYPVTVKVGKSNPFGTGNITITSGSALDLNGQALTSVGTLTLNGTGISSGGALINSGSAASFDGQLILGSASSIVGGSGAIAVSNTTTSITGSGYGLTLGGAVGGSIASVIGTGSGTVTKQGSGTWTLSGANTYTGATTVSVGTLAITNASGLGTTAAGTTIASGTTLDLQGVAVGAEAITISGGTLSTSTGTSSLSGAISLGASGSIISVAGTQLTLSGIISGSNGFTKDGSGILVLSNANTYTGTTIVSAGTLAITNATGLGTTAGGTTIASGATLDLQGVIVGAEVLTINGGTLAASTGTSSLSGAISLGASGSTFSVAGTQLTLSGIISGSNGFTKDGSGILVLSNANTYTGTTAVSAGTLAITNATGLGTTAGGTTIASGATLDLQNVAVLAEAITINGGTLSVSTGTSSLSGAVTLGATVNTFSVTGTQLTLSGVISGTNNGITKVGGGILVLSNTNTYTGPTTINAGTLSASSLANGGAASNIGQSTSDAANLVINGGTLRFTGGTAQSIDRLFTIGANGATLDGSGSSWVGFDNSGNLAILGSSSTLTLTGSGTSNRITSALVNPSGGTLSILKAGTGSWILSGANTFTDTAIIASGTLAINNSAALSGASLVRVDSAGSLLLQSSSTFTKEITLNGGALLGSSSGSKSINAPITLTADSIIANGGGSLTLQSGAIISSSNDFGVTYGTIISGTNYLGLVNINSSNNYTGITNIVSPLVIAGHANAFGNSVSAILLGVTSGTLNSGLYATGGMTIARDITVQAGSTGTATIGSYGAGSVVIFSGNIALNKKVKLSGENSTGNSVNFTGVISGNYGVDVSGGSSAGGSVTNGIVTLSNTNTYTGATTITNGGLTLGSHYAVNGSSGVTVNGGNVFDLGGYSLSKPVNLAAGAFLTNTNASSISELSGGIVLNTAANISASSNATLLITTNPITQTNSVTSSLTIGGGGRGGTVSVGVGGNTYTGGTSINITATLKIASDDALASTGSISILTYGKLDVAGNTVSNALVVNSTIGTNSLIYSSQGSGGALTGGIALPAINTGTLALAAATGATLTINTTEITGVSSLTIGSGIYLGTVVLAGNSVTKLTTSYTGATNVISGATLSLKFDGTPSFNSTYTGAGSIIIEPLTSGGSISLGSSGATLNLPVYLFNGVGGTRKFADGFANITIGSVGAGNLSVTGAATFQDSVALLSGANITIDSGASVSVSQASGNLVVAATGNFVNNAGASALVTTDAGSTDRWIVYSASPVGNTFGGLVSGNKAYWGTTYSVYPPASVGSGKRYVFSDSPTITTTNAQKTYGDTIDLSTNYSFSGAYQTTAATYGNVYLDVTNADIFSTLPTISSLGADANASVGTYAISASAAAANTGYGFSYANTGVLTVDPRRITVTGILTGTTIKQYDGTDTAALTAANYQLSGFVNGDDALVTKTVGAYSTPGAGTNKSVTATLTNADYSPLGTTNLDNYSLPTSIAGNIGSISQAPLGVSAEATYASSTSVTPSSATLTGLVAADSAATVTNLVLSNTNVGSGLYATALTLSNGAQANYVLNGASNATLGTDTTNTVTLNKATLTVSGTISPSKTYDGTTSATITGGTLNGVQGSDVVTLTQSGVYSSAAAGSGISITMSNSVSGTNVSTNYLFTQPVVTGSISRAALGVSAEATYASSTSVTPSSATLTGLVAADSAATVTNLVLSNANVGSGLYATALTLSNGAQANYVLNGASNTTLATDTTNTVTLNKATLTVIGTVAPSKTYDGSTSATITGGTLNGAQGSDVVTLTQSGVYSSAAAGSGISITMSNSVSGTNVSTNYLLTQPVVTGSISRAALGVSAEATYASSTSVTPSSATLTGLVSADSAATVTNLVLSNTNVGSGLYATALTLSNGAQANYVLNGASNTTLGTDTTNTVTLNKATLTVTGTVSPSKTYDGTTSATITGGILNGVQGSDVVTLNQSGVYSSAAAGSGISITMSNSVSGTNVSTNYLLTQPVVTGSISRAALGVSAEATYASSTSVAPSSATLTGLVSADSAATVTSLVLSNANVGSGLYATALTLSNGAQANYVLNSASNTTLGTDTTNTVTLNKATLTVTGTVSPSKTYDGTTSATITGGTLSGVQGSDVVTLAQSGVYSSAAAGSGISITMSNSVSGTNVSTNYLFTQPVVTGSISRAALGVSAEATYASSTSVTPSSATLTGLVSADSAATVTNLVLNNANVGSGLYATGLTLSNGAQANYVLNGTSNTAPGTDTTNTVTLSQVTLTYTATATTSIYGSAPSVNSGTVTGFVGGDTVGNATSGTLLFSTSAASSSNVGSYAINGGGLTANYGNYAFVQASANSAALTINKATLTVTGSQVYDGTTTFQGANLLVSGVNGQTFTASGNAELATRNVQVNQQLAGIGGLTLTPNSGASLSNYNNLSTTNTSVSVTPRSITITAPVVEKTYDAYAVYNPTVADLTQMSSALVGGDVVTSASTQFANVGAGANKILQLLSVSISDGNSGNNYSVTLQNSMTNVINKAALRITAANDAKFVTQTDAAGAANNCGVGVTCVGGYGGIIVNGLVNGETVADLTGSATVTRTNFSTNSANFYPGVLRPSGYSSNNYNITYVDGDYTIVPAQQLLVKIIPQSITYGNTVNYTGNLSAKYLAADNSTIVSLTPVINGAQISLNDGVGGTASFTVCAAGSSTSSSGYTKVGGYNFAAIDTVTTGANFSNNLVLVGSLNVAPIMMTTADLGVSGVTKTYDGRASINGLALEINPNLTRLLPNDLVSVLGTGTFNNQDVGTSKPISVNVALSGVDAGNYAMSSTTLAANLGTINQLGSVTWVGPSTGGVWSDSSNWLGGATPTLSNVALVVIPQGKTVVYDSPSVGQTSSTIVNNGVMAFNSASNFTLANLISGTGSISLGGTGVVTISGNNTFTGGVNINASSLVVGSANALGAGSVTSSGGSLSVSNGVTLPELTVNGPVRLSSTIRSAGSQTYTGAVTLAGGSSNTAMRLVSDNADVNFMSTLNSDASNRSLSVEAGAGVVSFGDKVGVFPLNYAGYTANGLGANIHDLTVEASNIVIKGDINTLNTQVYRGPLTISDNGSNGLVRKLLSIDPSITITSTIDDVTPYTHSLYIAAASLFAANLSVVDLQLGAAGVGARVPLLRWEVYSGLQDSTPSALMGTIAQGQAGTITFNGTSVSSGSYVVDSTNRGTSGSGGGAGDGSVALTTVSRLVNPVDVSGLIVVPANVLADVRFAGSLAEAPLIAPMRAMQLGEFERPFTPAEPDAMSVTIVHVCENDKTKPLHESCAGN